MAKSRQCMFVTTNKDTRLCLLLDEQDTVSVFKDKICHEHVECFPTIGKITICAVKVNIGDRFYHLSNSLILSQALQSFRNNEVFLFVDVEVLADMLTETATGSIPDLSLKSNVAEGRNKKRRMKTSASCSKSAKRPSLRDEISVKVEKEKPLNDEINLTVEAENQGLLVGDDSAPEAIQQKEKAAEEVKPVKLRRKTRSKKAKTPSKEDAEVASTSQNVEPAHEVVKDPMEDLDKVVKKIVEDA